MNRLMYGALILSICFLSCTKDNDNKKKQEANCRVVKVTGGISESDTVFVLKYNDNGRLKTVTDAGNGFFGTFTISYRGADSQHSLISSPKGDMEFLYTLQNRLVSVNNMQGALLRYHYDQNGTMNKIEFIQPGEAVVSYYHLPSFDSNGNLTDLKTYRSDNSLESTWKMTYTDMPNPLASFSAINLGNWVGMAQLFPGTIFHPAPAKNLASGYTIYDHKDVLNFKAEISYEKDTDGKVIRAKTIERSSSNNITGTFYWKFDYECQ